MKVQVESLSPSKRRLAIEVPQDAVSAEIERAFADLGRHAQVPGFRPGRVPRPVLERRFGDRVRSEVFGKLIQDSYAEALRLEQIDAVGQPQIETEQAEPGQALRYGATVEVRPDVDVDGYEGLDLERLYVAVMDADVDRYLGRLQESFAQLNPIEERTNVETGDVAILDYEGRVDGEVMLHGNDRPCQVGAGNFPEAFEARLVGAEVGETLEFPVTFAADHADPRLADKTVAFRVSVKGLASKYLPPLDDDFAKDHGECGSLEELRGRVRQRLEQGLAREVEQQLRAAAVAQLVAKHDVEVPKSLLERQLERLMMDVARRWEAQHIWPKDENSAFASLRQELAPKAQDQVKAALILDAIAGREQIEVTDAEVDAEVARSASVAGQQRERVRNLGSDPGVRRNVAEQIRRERALDLVLDRAHVRTVEPQEKNIAGTPENR